MSTPAMSVLYPPITAQLGVKDPVLVSLELQDGAVYQGYSFGAKKSVAGELVFQTGMVGYPESITDPSYRGQILVITFPLVGNYGVPSRETMDELFRDLPAHFESSQIHIAGLVTASYAGEDFSHYLATSSLGTWLEEQGVPAIYGVDTRALTKRIRTEGSMLGRMLLQKENLANGVSNGVSLDATVLKSSKSWRSHFENIDWVDPNEKNLVADGESQLVLGPYLGLTSRNSIDTRTEVILSKPIECTSTPLRQTHTRSMFGCWIEIQSIAVSLETGRGSPSMPMGLRFP
jgi:carbamoyl-phosphate synthase/aspartate carbamoyltransferase